MPQAPPAVLKTNTGLPPGPKGRFLPANGFGLIRGWISFLTRYARDYGDVVFFRFLNSPICLLTHPDEVEYVLVTNQVNFEKSRDYRALAQVMGNGLLTSEGEVWRRQRKLVQPAFRRENLVRYGKLMVEQAVQMLSGWQDGETRDIHQDMMRVTLEIAGRALFGMDMTHKARSVGAALQVVMEQFTRQASLSFLLPESWPLPTTRRLRRAIRELDSITYAILRDRRAKGDDAQQDLLGMLLDAAEEGGNHLTDRELRDEVVTLILAGHETTAVALSWTWYLLAQNTEAEAKLVQELHEVLGGRAPSTDDLPHLRYTEWIVKESMRLYPPAWGIGRRALERFEVRGYSLPARTNVFLVQWITHRDPRFYKDPEHFNPDRWRDDPIRTGTLPRFAYFPFGGGPRACIGASFAMMEVTLLLATIAQQFDISLAGGQSVELLPSVTLRPKHGIKMVLHKRLT